MPISVSKKQMRVEAALVSPVFLVQVRAKGIADVLDVVVAGLDKLDGQLANRRQPRHKQFPH